MKDLHNYMPKDYQTYKGVYKVGNQWYMAQKISSKWNLYVLHNARVVPYDTSPVGRAWIMIEFGESVEYMGITRLLEKVDKDVIIKYLHFLQDANQA
jgi:hypothetical protein